MARPDRSRGAGRLPRALAPERALAPGRAAWAPGRASAVAAGECAAAARASPARPLPSAGPKVATARGRGRRGRDRGSLAVRRRRRGGGSLAVRQRRRDGHARCSGVPCIAAGRAARPVGQQRKRVDRALLAAGGPATHLEVQVRRRGGARRADEPDDLAATHRRAEARTRRNGGEVRVARREGRPVLHADELAVAARPRGRLHERDPTARGGVDGRARRGEEVDAVVQVAGPRAAERAAAADDPGDWGREQRRCATRPGDPRQPDGAPLCRGRGCRGHGAMEARREPELQGETYRELLRRDRGARERIGVAGARAARDRQGEHGQQARDSHPGAYRGQQHLARQHRRPQTIKGPLHQPGTFDTRSGDPAACRTPVTATDRARARAPSVRVQR